MLALLAVGCAAQSPTTVLAGATPTATATPSAAATATPHVGVKPSTAPAPAATEPIGKLNLPPAASIGAGFKAHAENAAGDAPADANGAGIDERTPQDVADGLVPL